MRTLRRSAFDETLPISTGCSKQASAIGSRPLRTDMEDWMTRKFGEGRPVKLRFQEQAWK